MYIYVYITCWYTHGGAHMLAHTCRHTHAGTCMKAHPCWHTHYGTHTRVYTSWRMHAGSHAGTRLRGQTCWGSHARETRTGTHMEHAGAPARGGAPMQVHTHAGTYSYASTSNTTTQSGAAPCRVHELCLVRSHREGANSKKST